MPAARGPGQPSVGVCRQIVAAAAILTVAAGCALDSRHTNRFVLVHKDGYPINTHRERILSKGDEKDTLNVFKERWGKAILMGIDEYVEKAEKNGEIPKLLLYAHGGLNQYSKAIDYVGMVLNAIDTKRDQDNHELTALPRYYPVFINWDSSLLTSVWDDLAEIRFGERAPAFGYPSAPLEAAVRLGQGIFNTPTSFVLEFSNAWEGIDIKTDDTKQEDWCVPELGGQKSNDWRVTSLVVFAVLSPLRIATTPVIQGFGSPAWDMMKRRAQLVMGPAKSLTTGDRKAEGAGRLLMEVLKERITAPNMWYHEPTKLTKRLEITLVGHSMGTLVLNHVLEEYSELYFHRIVYLAAAASIDEVRAAVLPYLRRYPESAFWSFSLSETREALDYNLIDVYSRGSLLVWIDHFFQRINAPGDRAFGRARNLREYFEISDDLKKTPDGKPLPEGKPRFALVKFGRTDKDPQKHEDLSKVVHLDTALRMVDSGECPRVPASSVPAPDRGRRLATRHSPGTRLTGLEARLTLPPILRATRAKSVKGRGNHGRSRAHSY